MLGKWLGDKQDWAPLPLRLSLGAIFFAHGAQKVLGWFGGDGWGGTMQFFTQTLNIPAPLAAVAFLTEFLGGIALLLGSPLDGLRCSSREKWSSPLFGSICRMASS
jgi:putative oxidoreductase